MARKTTAKKTTARKKKAPARARASKSTAPPKASPPAAPAPTDPTAEELAAQGLALLCQALLSQQPADPLQPGTAFGIQELERGLAVVVGRGHAARLQRLDAAISALEASVLSEEMVGQMSPDDQLKLYRLVATELYRGHKYIKDLLSPPGAARRGSSLLQAKR